MIEKTRRVLDIIEEESEKKTIVVFKGFTYSQLIEIENKYFKKWSKIIVNRTNIEDLRSQVLQSTFEIMSSDSKVF